MPERGRYNRTFTFTFVVSLRFEISLGFDAVQFWIAAWTKKLVNKLRNVLDCWLLGILQRLAVAFVRISDLVAIGVVVVVANYLATQLNGQLHLDLPVGSIQIWVELIALYLLKKQ